MKNESRISVRTLTAMALLIAMSIVFSRVLSISTGFVRFNLGSLPVLLAGILFGPWAGFVVGMVADIIGGVLGLVISVGIILLAVLLDNKIHTEDDIAKYLDLAVVGVIPEYQGGKRK